MSSGSNVPGDPYGQYPTNGTVVPPFGVPNGVGGFVNPAGFGIMTRNLLPAIAPLRLDQAPMTAVMRQNLIDANAGALALSANRHAEMIAPSSSTNSVFPNVGSEGSLGLEGASANANPAGPTASGAAGGSSVMRPGLVNLLNPWDPNRSWLAIGIAAILAYAVIRRVVS